MKAEKPTEKNNLNTATWKEEKWEEGAKEVLSVSRSKKSLEIRQLSTTERPRML